MQIKDVAEKYNLTSDTIRYYEKEGLIGPINKNKSGIRDFSDNDLQRLEFVVCMRRAKVPINVLKEYLDLFDSGEDTIDARCELLKQQKKILKKQVSEINEAIKLLDYKIKLYNKMDTYLK